MGANISEQEIVSALRLRLPGLLAVYLFGSRATGQAGGDSDLDLAVLVEGKHIAAHNYQALQLPITVAIIETHLDDFLDFSRKIILYDV